jgi:hypothetical protein
MAFLAGHHLASLGVAVASGAIFILDRGAGTVMMTDGATLTQIDVQGMVEGYPSIQLGE